MTLSALLGMVWGGYVDGLTALIKLVPALVCGAIFVLSADRLGLLPGEGGHVPILLRRRAAAPDAADALPDCHVYVGLGDVPSGRLRALEQRPEVRSVIIP